MKMLMLRLVSLRGWVLAVVMAALVPSVAPAQRVTGQSAAESFSSGNYRKAYEEYTHLLLSFPRDPVYLYGAGASLVHLSTTPAEAAELLSRALSLSSPVRVVPADARFYLARALHQAGRFDEAVSEYDRFSTAAGRRVARELSVPEFIRQCNDRQGAVMESLPVSQPEVAAVKEKPVEAEEVKILPEPVIRPPDTIASGTDSLLTRALMLRQESESLAPRARIIEERLKNSGPAGRDTLIRQLEEVKREAAALLRVSDSLMAAAGLEVYSQGNREEIKVPRVSPVTVVAPVAPVTSAADTTGIITAGDTTVTEPEPVTRVFGIRNQQWYTTENPVTVSEAFPAGLFYTIQLAVFRNPVAPSHFKRLFPVFGIRNRGSELTYYYTGVFRTGEDAARSLPAVRNEGFKDAFIVIFMDGKQVSPERGAILEKEWASRGFEAWKGVVDEARARVNQADTVPPTLLFRVEIARTQKPVPESKLAGMEKIASERGLEIMNPSAGIYVYLVGKFLTFESASSYADLLRRNGYSEARVAAYLGNREIPVETALKFFER